jgi:hypothetical protein
MSVTITAGVNSIIVNLATPYEEDGVTVRDDFAGIRVWYSTSPVFLPPLQGQLAYDGPGLSVTISLNAEESKLTYYVRYSYISDIDPSVIDISSNIYKVTPKNINDLDFTLPAIPDDPEVNKITATSGFSFIYISQAAPAYSAGHGHLKARVYGLNQTLYPNKAEKIENAELQLEFTGTIGSFNSDPSTKWLIWVTWVSVDGAQSSPILESKPFGPIKAETAVDVTQLVDAVVNGTGSPFVVVDKAYTKNQGTPDQFYVPKGVYATAAFITDGFITNIKIADGTIDSAKINTLDAIHLTAGDGTVGGVLKSSNYDVNPSIPDKDKLGWAIFPSGKANFAAADIRGQLNAGQIDATGLSIRRKNEDGSYTTILDSGRTIQEQINNYAVNASAGITLNFDPTCSNTTAWDSRNIAVISDGLNGSNVLAGSNGEHLFEGITINKAYTINYDKQKRYQLSALIRRTAAATSGNVHLGLLEVDSSNTARYDWGGYLATKIPVNSLSTIFKRYYGYFGPGDLHDGTTKVILHAILGYPNTGGGRVEIQDIKLEDISQGHAVQFASTTTAAVDASNKSTAVLNTAQTNMGINSWIVNRYSVSVPAGIIPDYTWFTNITPVQTVAFKDTASLSGNTIFGNNYDNYIAVATCNVYCDAPIIWNTTISGDDGHILYVNGNSVTKSGVLRAAAAVTINLPKGWSTIEAVWCDQTGSDGFYFGSMISSVVGISQMWGFIGGATTTAGIAASAATTSTWAGTVNIPYDKIFATDATTTLGFNPSFELWTGVYPDKWDLWDGTAPIKETTTTRFGTNAIKYVAKGEAGLGIQRSSTWTQPMPLGTFISGTMDLNLLTVTSGLPGILVRLFTKANLSTYVDTRVQPTNALNTWQRVPFTARVGLTEQIYGLQVFIMGSWSGFSSGAFTGTVAFDGLTFAFFDNTIDNKDITVDDTGKLTGTGAKDVVVNNEKINVDATTGKLTGTGATDVVVNNQKITISGTGALEGIGTGVNTVVSNEKITINNAGGLEGIGTGAYTIVDNTKIIVGGTNLIRNSGNFVDTTNWSSNGGVVSISTDVGNQYGSKKTLQIDPGNGNGIVNDVIMRLNPNTYYTVSAIVKGSVSVVRDWNQILHIQTWTNENPNNLRQETQVTPFDTSVTTNWKQIYQTFVTPSSTDSVYCRFYFYPINIRLNIAYLQLEKGNKISDWSPSPDDVTAAIAKVASNTDNDFLKNKVANILPKDGEFTLQTGNYDAGSGVIISPRGILAKKNSKDTFAIGNDGTATFSGDLNIVRDTDNRVNITTDTIEVWNAGVKRVVLGKLS